MLFMNHLFFKTKQNKLKDKVQGFKTVAQTPAERRVPLLSSSLLPRLLLLRVLKNVLKNGLIFLKNYSRNGEVSFQSLSPFSEILG